MAQFKRDQNVILHLAIHYHALTFVELGPMVVYKEGCDIASLYR